MGTVAILDGSGAGRASIPTRPTNGGSSVEHSERFVEGRRYERVEQIHLSLPKRRGVNHAVAKMIELFDKPTSIRQRNKRDIERCEKPRAQTGQLKTVG